MEKLRHTSGIQKEWNESYYFYFYDPQNNIGGFTRIGFTPNRKEGSGYLFLFYKDEILVFHKSIEIFEVPEVIQVEPLQFRPEWTITFSGVMAAEGTARNVSMMLTFHPLSAEFSYLECVDQSQREIGKVVCEDHYEQMGFIKGVITVDSQSYTFSGFGERDHSWGERDWNAPDLWIYVTAHFDKAFGINIAKMLKDGQEIDAGFIMKKGENIPVKKVLTTLSEEPAKEFQYTIVDSKGNTYVLEGKVLKTVEIPYKRENKISVLNESLSQVMCESKKGYGIAECLIKVQ